MTLAELKTQREEAAAEIRRLADLSAKKTHKWSSADERAWQAATTKHDDAKAKIDEAPDENAEAYRRAACPDVNAHLAGGSASGGGQRWIDKTSGREVRSFGVGDGSVAQYLEQRDGVDREMAGLGVGAFLRSMVAGPQSDAERRALSEGSDSAGGYAVPTMLSANIIDKLRARATVMAAGAQVVPLSSDNLTIARVATDPTAAWRAENAAVGTGDPTFDSVALAPKWLGVVVRASRELIADSPNIETALERALIGSLSAELDRVILEGDPSGSSGEPTGIIGQSGINTVALNDVLENYSSFIDAVQAIEEDNAMTPTNVILHPRDSATLAKLADTTGQPLQRPPMVDDLTFRRSTNIAINGGSGETESTVYVGGFSEVLIGIRSIARVEVLKERYADNHQLGFLAWLRADVAVSQPKAICTLTGVGRIST